MGRHDVENGLAAMVDTFSVDTRTNPLVAQDILIVMFVFVFVANSIFFLRFFAPWLDRTLADTKRVAQMLSELPPELKVDALILNYWAKVERLKRQAKSKRGSDGGVASPPGSAGAGRPPKINGW